MGGGVLTDSRARLLGRATGGSRGGTMPTGTDRTHHRACHPRHRSPRGGGETGPCSGAVLRGRSGRRRTGLGRVTRAGVRLTGGAAAEVGEDLVDHRRLRDEGDDPHRALTRRARERVDLEDLLEERGPPAAGLGRREAWHGEDGGWRLERDGLRLPSQPARAIGIPAGVARRDVALVRDMHQDPGQERERVDGLGPRRWPLRLVERYVAAFAVRSYVSRSSATGLRVQYRASRAAKARSSSGTQTAVCTWKPDCGQVSIPAA